MKEPLTYDKALLHRHKKLLRSICEDETNKLKPDIWLEIFELLEK